MKVQINEESAKKFTRQYFEKQKVVQKTYEYKYTSGDKPMMHIAFNIDINFFYADRRNYYFYFGK